GRDRCRTPRAAPGGTVPGGDGRQVPQVLRHLPGAAARRRAGRAGPHRPADAGGGDQDRGRDRPRPARRVRTGADVRAHEAGTLHADLGHRGPAWLRTPPDVNELVAPLWSSTAVKTDALYVGGVDVRELVAEHGSPAYVLDEQDFRSRARAFREGFDGFDVFYAGKAFLCSTVVRWVMGEGLNLDVFSGGELGWAL